MDGNEIQGDAMRDSTVSSVYLGPDISSQEDVTRETERNETTPSDVNRTGDATATIEIEDSLASMAKEEEDINIVLPRSQQGGEETGSDYEKTTQQAEMHGYQAMSSEYGIYAEIHVDSKSACQQTVKLERQKLLIAVVILCLLVAGTFVGIYFLMIAQCERDQTGIREEPTTAFLQTDVPLIYTSIQSTVRIPSTSMAASTTQGDICLTATNLTEQWRVEYNGTAYGPGGPHTNPNGYACDLHADLQWFRFTGLAGNRLLDTCPKWKSCGTYLPMWSDDDVTQEVRVISSINAYVVAGDDCRITSQRLAVMRCSLQTDYDIIYRYVPSGSEYLDLCNYAFCGMY